MIEYVFAGKYQSAGGDIPTEEIGDRKNEVPSILETFELR
jgi:hypothetical protein